MPREWDGSTYDRIAGPQTRWGTTVLERLPLRGDETVLDAGCGSGRVTEQLVERLPDGRVIALDASANMLEAARARLAPWADRVTFVQADLARPLALPEPVDAVVSTATFHWVLDHDALFRNVAAVMQPGGRLVAQCGGAGNVASVMAALDDTAPAAACPWFFATAEDTAARLAAAGFTGIETWLHEEPTEIPADDFESYMTEVILGSHVAALPGEERASFVAAVIDRLDGPRLDYVRLNIVATCGPNA